MSPLSCESSSWLNPRRGYNHWVKTLEIPKSWYYAGNDQQFTARPKLISLPAQQVVVYRTSQGQLKAVESRCPHMKASLTRARVSGQHLVCPMHNWAFDSQGKCVSIPGASKHDLPQFACLKTFTVAEWRGHVFIHTDPNHKGELPFFENENLSEYKSAQVRELNGTNHWSLSAGNAFDLAHFEFVHYRKPTAPPQLMQTSQTSLRLKLSYDILGKSLADRFLIKRFGEKATLDYTVHHGNMILAKTQIGKFENRMMILIHPAEVGFKAWLFVLEKPSRSPIKKLKHELAAYFSYQFFANECQELEGISFETERKGPRDELLGQYYDWLKTQTSQEKPSPSGTLDTTLWQITESINPVTISQT